MVGILYIVSTPIGNLEDITLRAIRTLKEADIIAAEDTRVTRKLLSHYDIHTPMIAYHQHSNGRRAEEILGMILEGKKVALVSDAGTPGISDPGHELIAMCIGENVRIESIPGPTAIITAVVASGLNTTHFAFDSFVPRKDSERRAFFQSLKYDTRTVCVYEAPSRLLSTLDAIRDELGERKIAVARELTKIFEEIFRGTVSQAIERFSQGKVRGEIVIVLEGASPEAVAEHERPDMSVENRLRELMEAGVSERDAIRQCMIEFKLPKRQVYSTAIKLKENREP